MHRPPTLALGLCLLLGAAVARADAAQPLESLAELAAVVEDAAVTGNADEAWARIQATGAMPLVFGRTAVFFYRGPGESVEWRGEFTSWYPTWDAAGERVGATDLWHKTLMLLPGSRLDYKILVDGDWILDPANPYQQVGGFGPNSEARMPDWSPSPYIVRGPNTPRGAFTENIPVESRHLGYTVNVRVHTPAGLAPGRQDLPVLFVTDGSDYYRDEMGAMVIVLDRLFEEGLIEPLVTVFVDPWDEGRKNNRREGEMALTDPADCPFCDFLVEELSPVITRRFGATGDPARRGILGTSYGGLFTAHMGLVHADTFGLIAMQSPAFHPYVHRHVWNRLMAAESFPAKAVIDVGLYERRYVHDSRRAAIKLEELGVDVLYIAAPEGHSWGHWRAYLDDILVHFYGASQSSEAESSEPW